MCFKFSWTALVQCICVINKIVFQIYQLHKLWMHALQKGLVEKDYCLALLQCNFVVRLCFKFNCTALTQCIRVVRSCFKFSCIALAQCISADSNLVGLHLYSAFVLLIRLCFKFISCTAVDACPAEGPC